MRNSQTFNIHYKVNFNYFIKKLYKKQTINSEPWKNFKYEIFSGLYFPKFSPNTGRHRPEKNSVFGHFSRSEK